MAELAVEKLSLHFGGLTVLDDVSFSVETGELFALIGPNGAGKNDIHPPCTKTLGSPAARSIAALLLAVVVEKTPGAELVVAGRNDSLIARAGQHLRNVIGAKSFARHATRTKESFGR